jgi:transcriptional regulator with XRE-family HTH domain
MSSRKEVAGAFGRVLKLAREDLGLSQEELAALAEIHDTYPSLLELGKRQPTLGILLSLAAALQMTPEALVTRTCALLRQRRTP